MNKEAMIARFEAEMSKVQRPGMDKLMEYIRKSDFYTAPASTRFHLSAEVGLLRHSLSVLDAMRGMLCWNNVEQGWEYHVAAKRLDIWKDETVILVSLLHDICKTYFYTVSYRNAKNDKGKWEKVPYFTVKDRMPLGHGAKSAMIAKQYIPLTNAEMYAIWWHMGYCDTQDTLTLNNALDQYPIIWALHTADVMASHYMEADTANRELFAQPSQYTAGEFGERLETGEPEYQEAPDAPQGEGGSNDNV